MIRSMTGYGKGYLNVGNREYQVEIKSVNHRYLDISIKIPKMLSYLEEDIKKQISKRIKRGKVDVYITFENTKRSKSALIPEVMFILYIGEPKIIASAVFNFIVFPPFRIHL